ncbi:MAG: bacteriocin-like protein [Alteromonadaceae bacterium]|jgi:bacteriocin-like protein
MKELNQDELNLVVGGFLPAVAAYYLYMGSSISGVYSWAKWMSEP